MSLLQRKGLGLKGWVLAGAVAAVFAVGGLILGCGDEGDSNTPGGGDDDPPIPGMGVGGGGDPALVGDWELVSGNGEPYEREDGAIMFIRIMSSGKVIGEAGFVNLVDNIWVEGQDRYSNMTWNSKGQTLYVYSTYRDEIDTSSAEYRISGNNLTIASCYYDDWDDETICYEDVYAKVDVNAIKRSLGTVYAMDTVLSGSKPRTELSWVLQSDESQRLEFWGVGFQDPSCHYSLSEEEYGCQGYYYTTGSRLVLLYGNEVQETVCYEYDDDGDCIGSYTEYRTVVDKSLTVELTYKIANKNLELRRSPSGSAEIWLPEERSWDDDYYAPAKSRQSKQASIFGNSNSNSKGKGIFPRPPAARSR